MKRHRFSAGVSVLAMTALWTAPAQAQYKVVAADGSVTYTDRPRADANARVTNLAYGGAAQPVEAALPLELRQAAQRYPVTLYTGNNCLPCDTGRQLLQQRGIPYAERRVTTEDDAIALERAVGGRTVPALTIGTQALRGLSEGDWTAYLDAAAYPRTSQLPRNWQPAPALPVAEKASVARTAPASPPRPDPLPVDDAPSSGRVRF
jgi:glutaredoxin